MTDLRKVAQQALEKISKAHEKVSALCSGDERWTMSVPVRQDHDHDVVISDALRASEAVIRAALAQPDVPVGVSADSQNPRDKDDVPLERAVLVREWKSMRLAISTPRSQPDGYVLVPVEPTEEMAYAGARSIIEGREKRPGASWAKEAQMAYAAMLAAAPKGGA